jgi:hypothetical protein
VEDYWPEGGIGDAVLAANGHQALRFTKLPAHALLSGTEAAS